MHRALVSLLLAAAAPFPAFADMNSCREALVVSSAASFQSSSSDARLSSLVTESSYNEARRNAGISAIIYGIPVGANYDEYNQNRQERLNRVQSSLSTNEIQNVLWTGLNAISGDAYSACLRANVLSARGLHLTVRAATASDVSLTVTWTPQGGDPSTLPISWAYNDTHPVFPLSITSGTMEVVIPRPRVERTLAINAAGFSDAVTLTPLPPIHHEPDRPNPQFRLLPTDAPPPCDAGPAPQRVPTADNGLINLALLQSARAQASSVIPGYPQRHQVTNLNDGWYNNCRSWIPATMPSWAMIDLGESYAVSAVAFGSEYQANFRDRAATVFTISVATTAAPNTWIIVYSSTPGEVISGRRVFQFTSKLVRYVRVEVSASMGGAVRIDELEIYGRY